MSVQLMIVEDEDAIAKGLQFNFELEGYSAVVFADGPSALKYFDEHAGEIDCVVLDLMLPGMSGYEVCKAIRQLDKLVPILVLSARTLSEDKMHAFDCGTDQYMTKPFALPELINRVRNLLERHRTLRQPDRAESPPADVFQFDNVTVNFTTFQVAVGDRTHKQAVLEFLARRP